MKILSDNRLVPCKLLSRVMHCSLPRLLGILVVIKQEKKKARKKEKDKETELRGGPAASPILAQLGVLRLEVVLPSFAVYTIITLSLSLSFSLKLSQIPDQTEWCVTYVNFTLNSSKYQTHRSSSPSFGEYLLISIKSFFFFFGFMVFFLAFGLCLFR